MAKNDRPYLVTHQGNTRMVEASSPHAAASHVLGTDVVVKAATGAEMRNWMKADRPIEVAGEKPAAKADDDALRTFLVKHLVPGDMAADAAAQALFRDGHLTGIGFDAIAKSCPDFGTAILSNGPGNLASKHADMVKAFDTKPMPIDMVRSLVDAFVTTDTTGA